MSSFDYTRFFLHVLANRATRSLSAFEVAGASICLVDADTATVEVLVHLRGRDDAPPETKQQAVDAFKEIIASRAVTRNDAALLLTDARDERGSQYCLVDLMRDESGEPRAAVAAIVYCTDRAEALSKLATLKGHKSLGP